MKSSLSLINENKLFSVIGKFFTDGSNLLLELIQNAQRAGAQNVDIQFPFKGVHPFSGHIEQDYLLRISDDGRGVRDIKALLGIAISDWEREIASQDPAGMGFLQLIALSKQVFIQSYFGTIHIDCPQFLGSETYRQEVLASVDVRNINESGTLIVAELKDRWHRYFRSDMSWYRGYDQMMLTINGESMQPLDVQDFIDNAIQHKNLYRITEYDGNTLFLEIGSTHACVPSHRSIVNWYGQLIPIYTCNGIASSYQTGLYYYVRNNTPLTPRFPDRSQINCDDRREAFFKYVNQCYLEMLREYFQTFSVAPRFSSYLNATLLELYFGDEEEAFLESFDHIPYIDNPFCGNGEITVRICSKRKMLEEGIPFCTSDLQVNDTFSLGTDYDEFRCYLVKEAVAKYLRLSGLKEVEEVESLKEPKDMINIEPLILKILYRDGTEHEFILPEALLMDSYNDVWIFAPSVGSVLSVFEAYFEETYIDDGESDRYIIEDDIRERIDQKMVESYSILCRSLFNFLPRYSCITQINFQSPSLYVTYNDGSSHEYKLTS